MSRVSSGEVKQTPSTGDVYTYPGSPNNQDSLIDPNVQPGDENRIYSNKFPWINNVRYISSRLQKQQNLAKNAKSSLAKQTEEVQKRVVNKALEPYGQMQDVMSNGVGNYAGGKPQNLLGISPLARLLPTAAGIGAGINQLAWWKRQGIDAPDTYAPNPNEARALSTLAGLRDNPYAQLREMQDVERRAVNEGNRAGGTTGSQKYLANVANSLGLQRNYANVLAANREANNKYRAQYAQAALTAGAQDAQNRQNANQFGYNAYRDAHGRKVKGIETGIANILSQLQSGFQNEFKYRMGNKTLEMYLQELDNERKKIAALYGDIGTTGTTSTAPQTTNTNVTPQQQSILQYFNPTNWVLTAGGNIMPRINPYGTGNFNSPQSSTSQPQAEANTVVTQPVVDTSLPKWPYYSISQQQNGFNTIGGIDPRKLQDLNGYTAEQVIPVTSKPQNRKQKTSQVDSQMQPTRPDGYNSSTRPWAMPWGLTIEQYQALVDGGYTGLPQDGRGFSDWEVLGKLSHPDSNYNQPEQQQYVKQEAPQEVAQQSTKTQRERRPNIFDNISQFFKNIFGRTRDGRRTIANRPSSSTQQIPTEDVQNSLNQSDVQDYNSRYVEEKPTDNSYKNPNELSDDEFYAQSKRIAEENIQTYGKKLLSKLGQGMRTDIEYIRRPDLLNSEELREVDNVIDTLSKLNYNFHQDYSQNDIRWMLTEIAECQKEWAGKQEKTTDFHTFLFDAIKRRLPRGLQDQFWEVYFRNNKE